MHGHSRASWCSLGLLMLAGAVLARPVAAQTPTTYQACYVPSLGALYLIGLPGLPTACLATSHVPINWTDGSQAVRTGTTAAGDLSGTYPNPAVARLQGTAVASTVPTSGQVLTYNGTSWTPGAVSVSGTASGDLGGTYPGPTVLGLRSRPLADVTPTSGQVLTFDGTNWAPAAATLTGAASGDLGGTFPGPTVLGLRSRPLANVTPTSGQVLTFDGTNWTPATAAVSGTAGGDLAGTYPNPSVARLQGRAVVSTAPTSGQVLSYNGTSWAPATLAAGVTVHGLLSGLTIDDHPQYLLGEGTRTYVSPFVVTGTLGSGVLQVSGVGVRLMWYPGKAAFRAGSVAGSQWDDASIGTYSTAMGSGTTASGNYSTALGESSTASALHATAMGDRANASGWASMAMGAVAQASGNYSTAMGFRTTASGHRSTAAGDSATASGRASTSAGSWTVASGDGSTALGGYTLASGPSSSAIGYADTASGSWSTAFGDRNVASGDRSTAMGATTTASGYAATAMGIRTIASGNYSTAMGYYASTNNFAGAFVYGDNSTTNLVNAPNANSFTVRAVGGIWLRTDAALSLGCTLPAGSGSWSCSSSRLLKTDFAAVDGEDVLARVRELPVERWSYRTEPGVRHIGTFAEDFHRAFGLGSDAKSIGAIDMDGVNLAAVKALEQRTRDLQQQLDVKNREVSELRQRLERLEAALAGPR